MRGCGEFEDMLTGEGSLLLAPSPINSPGPRISSSVRGWTDVTVKEPPVLSTAGSPLDGTDVEHVGPSLRLFLCNGGFVLPMV